jgi:hypothetical protein
MDAKRESDKAVYEEAHKEVSLCHCTRRKHRKK